MKKLLFIDIDGTLLNDELLLSDKDRDAFLSAKKHHDIFITTGRNYYDIPDSIKSLSSSFICLNGSFITHNNSMLRELVIAPRTVTRILKFFNEHSIEFYLETDKGNFCSKGYKPLANERYKEYLIYKNRNINQSIHQYDSLIEADEFDFNHVYRISYLLHNEEEKEELLAHFKCYEHVFWGGKSKNFGELSIKGVNKGSSVRFISKYMNYRKKDTIGIGDSNIDIPMFYAVGTAVAMGNAKDYIKELADVVTASVDENGVAVFLNNLK